MRIRPEKPLHPVESKTPELIKPPALEQGQPGKKPSEFLQGHALPGNMLQGNSTTTPVPQKSVYLETTPAVWMPQFPSVDEAAAELGAASLSALVHLSAEELGVPQSEAGRALQHLVRLSRVEGVQLDVQRLQQVWPFALATYQELVDLGFDDQSLWSPQAKWPELSSEQTGNQRGLIAWSRRRSSRPVDAMLNGLWDFRTYVANHTVESTEWHWKHHSPVRAKHDRYGHTLSTPAPLLSEGVVSPHNFTVQFAPNPHSGQLDFWMLASESLSLYTAGFQERRMVGYGEEAKPELLALATNLLITCQAMGLTRGTYAAFARQLFDSLDTESQEQVAQWVAEVGTPQKGPRRMPGLMRFLYAHVPPNGYDMSPSRFMYKQARKLESPYREQLWKMYTNQPEEPGNLVVETGDRPAFLDEKKQAARYYWFRGDLTHYYKAIIRHWKSQGSPERFVAAYFDASGFNTQGPGYAMGNYTIAHGQDERGEYLQIYDVWDLHPPALRGTEASKFLPGSPIHLTKRIYLADFA